MTFVYKWAGANNNKNFSRLRHKLYWDHVFTGGDSVD